MASQNFAIIRGDDKDLKFTIKDVNGDVFSIVGYTVYFTAKENLSQPDESAVIQKSKVSTAGGDPDDDGSLGKIMIPLTNEDTDIPTKLYYHDIQLISPSNKVSSSPAGRLKIVQDVTRDS